jgi:hypothetical protein
VFAIGLWILGLVAGRSTIRRILLVAMMGAGIVPLLTIPLARRILALQLPPATILTACAGMVLAAIAVLTLWPRWREPGGRFR